MSSAALQMVAIYVPFLQKILGTVSLGLADWAIIIAIVLVAFILIDLRKFILKRN
ncbi:cation transporting ATPase C-terminal domain-containing protein [Patescibacteria group bacterium]